MEYYLLAQDERITSYEYPLNITRRELLKQVEAVLIEEGAVLQFYVAGGSDYIDWMEHPIPLASEQLKQICETYQPDLTWKLTIFADVVRKRQSQYCILCPEEIDCLSILSGWNKDGTLKRMVLNEDKINGHKIFRVQGSATDDIIVDLDVAECILKFNLTGIRLHKINTEA